jgi:hypothetical protein
MLSVSGKLEIIKKEQISITVLMLNNMVIKKNILQRCVTTQPSRKTLKSSNLRR